MKEYLRDHPKLRWQGISTWPPQCSGSYGRGDKFPALGQGKLAGVKILAEDYIGPRRLGVTIEHGGMMSSGQVPADDPEVVTRLYEFLKDRIGQPLGKIGDELVDL
jgi:hypothetical protein